MNNIESIGRAILSLALVVGLMWLLGRWARGRGRRRGRTRDGLEVLARQQLSRNASVAVVRIADRAIILGVTDTQVSMLGDVSPEVFEDAAVLTVVQDEPLAGAPALPAATIQRRQTPARRRHSAGGALDGSALSPATWSQALEALRARTTRH